MNIAAVITIVNVILTMGMAVLTGGTWAITITVLAIYSKSNQTNSNEDKHKLKRQQY